MLFEVEQKFRVADRGALEAALTALGARFEPAIAQVDHYFAHPARDFSRTDEALRIRQVGEQCWITYKGPKLDAETKTRRELELPLASGSQSAADFAELLGALGFVPAGEVHKSRRPATLPWQGAVVHVALDDVEQLGPFAELELTADADGLDQARATLASLAQACHLCDSERRSYLELLLARNRDG